MEPSLVTFVTLNSFDVVLRRGVDGMDLHQKFKRAFIAGMPHAGGTIPANEIVTWLQAHPIEAPSAD